MTDQVPLSGVALLEALGDDLFDRIFFVLLTLYRRRDGDGVVTILLEGRRHGCVALAVESREESEEELRRQTSGRHVT